MNTLKTVLLAILVMSVTVTAAVAPAIASHDDGDDDVIIHEEITLDDSIQQIWVDIQGEDNITTSDNTTNATVVIDGENGSDTTELHNETVLIEEGNVSSSNYTLADSDSDDYETANLTVETDQNNHGQHINGSQSDWGTLVEQVGGGGGFLGGEAGFGMAGAAILLGGAWLWLREE